MSLKDRLLTAALSHLLAFRSRPQAIRHAVNRFPPLGLLQPESGVLRVAVVQMEFDFVPEGAQYARKIYALAKQAADRGARLVAFPEYAWTPLLGMLPNIRELEKQVRGGLTGAAAAGGAELRDLLLFIAPHVERAFLATGGAVARALGIFLMNGTTIARDEAGCLYNVAHMFAPDGSHIGAQKKMNAFTTEAAWLTLGNELHTFDMEDTRVAVPVCMDFTYWETTRLAYRQGAEILINPSADDFGEYEGMQARGVRARVQEVPCYGILANMVTDRFGLHWRGPSLIVQPTALGSSIVAQTRTTDREEVVVAELDLVKLRALDAALQRDFNPVLLRTLLPRAYASAARARG